MAIGIYINPASMTAAQYDQIIGRLDAAGTGNPASRLHHTCFGSGDKLQVFEVWESQQAFDKFGETLMPIIQEIGVDPGSHVAEPVHNLIPG
jgi:hypothetical protein